MSSTPSHQPETVNQDTSASDEIDLRQIACALGRYRRLIAGIAGTSVLISVLYAFTRKPVWEGQFQIVLEDQATSSSISGQLLGSNPGLASMIGIGTGVATQLQTEVKILESPSVLKPVFDFVKETKAKKGNSVERLRYTDWVNSNLRIELVKGTSVLNIAYRDNDNKIILPVIERISKTYQAYSGKDRERGIFQAIEYLDEQILVYQAKSLASTRAAMQYAIAQDLTALQNSNKDANRLNIQEIRTEAANQIRIIDEQLKQLEEDSETMIYVGRNIPELANIEITKSLNEVDIKLALARSKFTNEDDSVRRLQEKRRLLIDVFKRHIYGYLNAKRISADARRAATQRPKGVLIKYRELLRTAARNEKTLNRLEAERQALGLEQARKQEPWELISTPTLLDYPVAPSKKRLVAIGLMAGVVFGSGAALLIDRRTGLVYSEEELKRLLPFTLLKHLSAKNQDTWTDAADLLASGPLSEVSGNSSIALIPLGKMPNDILQTFSGQLAGALKGRELLVSTDLRKTSRCVNQLVITAPGIATRAEISQFREKLALQGTPLAGWILINPEFKAG